MNDLANILNLLGQTSTPLPRPRPLVTPDEEQLEGEWDPKATGSMPAEGDVENLDQWPITSVPAPFPSTVQPVPSERNILEVLKLNKAPSPFRPIPQPLSDLDLLLMKNDPENKLQ